MGRFPVTALTATLRLAGGTDARELVSITSSGLAHAEIVGYLFCFLLEVSVAVQLNLFASQGRLIAWLSPLGCSAGDEQFDRI